MYTILTYCICKYYSPIEMHNTTPLWSCITDARINIENSYAYGLRVPSTQFMETAARGAIIKCSGTSCYHDNISKSKQYRIG